MKRIFFALPMMALLCISCSKTEQQPVQGFKSTESTASVRSNAKQTLCLYWWTGDPYEHECIDYTVTDSLCYMTLGCEDLYSLAVDLDIDDDMGNLTAIRIPVSSLNPAQRTAFGMYLDRGFISFADDSPIDDGNILGDNIPAGNYPISMVDSTFVISISGTSETPITITE